ncbi:MAG: toll/interleukin-1 receptor domain-containing protein, partial [Saprospiraceae bacterium]|nr:toll/interleukin-1 receptor domain-containing protein [Saprospiraceae bacterium]
MTVPLNVFISYSHNALDRPLLDELLKHLAPLQLAENPLLKTWDDADIRPGEAWDEEIKQNLRAADIVFLLVSADFNSSRYIQEIELKEAIQRHQRRECQVIPIYLRPCDFRGMPYAGLEMLPKVPATQRLAAVTDQSHWQNTDLAFT